MRARGLVVTVAVMLAAAAAAAVFMYVRGVRKQAEIGEGHVQVVVSKIDIQPGAELDGLISEGVFTTRLVAEDEVVRGAVTGLEQIRGRETSSPILAGEQISTARLRGDEDFGGGILGIPDGHEAVTVPLEVSRAAGGALHEGDHVTVYATFSEPADTTVALAPDVQVLKVESTASGEGSGVFLVTMALKPQDGQRIVFAEERGTVWLALLPPDEEGHPEPPVSYGEVAR